MPPGQPPLVYGLRGVFMSTACFRAVACHVPFFRALAGFFGTGLCAAVRALPPLVVEAGTRCRTMAPLPAFGRSAFAPSGRCP